MKKITLLSFLVIILLTYTINPLYTKTSQQSNNKKHVLLISSYHPAFPTFFEQVNGIKSALNSRQVELDIEFMDSKRYFSKQNTQNFYNLLFYKIQHHEPYDAIIVSDDNALNFLIEHYQTLFPGIPAVFCGANNIANALKQNKNKNVTGIVEAVSMQSTLELMINLSPGSAVIYAIVDETPSSKGDMEHFRSLQSDYPDVLFKELSLENMSFKELEDTLRSLEYNSSVLLLSAYRDRSGVILDFDESLELIKNNLNRPLYHLWYHGMGEGVMGGKLISHFEQGKAAAEIVLQILSGKAVEDIPVVEESPNKYVFDLNELQKYRINRSILPENSIILNEETDFYKVDLKTLLLILSAFLILVIFFVTLLRYTLKLRKLRSELLISDKILQHLPEAIILIDLEGKVKSWSGHAQHLFNLSSEQVIGLPFDSIRINSAIKDNLKEVFAKTKKSGEVISEAKFINSTGKEIVLDLTAALSPGISGDPQSIIIIYRDVTERKQIELKIRESEELLHRIAENIPNSYISIIKKDYTVEFTSGSEFKKRNLNPNDIIGRSVDQIFGEQAEFVKDHFAKAFAGEEQVFELVIKDQHQLYHIVPIYANDGRIYNILSVAENISERKKNESQMVHLLSRSEKQRKANLIIMKDLSELTKNLKAEINEREKAEIQIQQDLREKNILLQELYHRTKNNMQVISSLLNIKARGLKDESTKTIFKEITSKISTMALVHQKLYQAQDLSRINLKEYIQDLVKLIVRGYQQKSSKITFQYDLEDVFVLIDTVMPLGLAINELITNIYKHAFPNQKSGEIQIKMNLDSDNTINIILSDNGVGISDKMDLRQCKSMGLQTMFSLVEHQMQGSIEYKTDNGLTWHLKLKDTINTERV